MISTKEYFTKNENVKTNYFLLLMFESSKYTVIWVCNCNCSGAETSTFNLRSQNYRKFFYQDEVTTFNANIIRIVYICFKIFAVTTNNFI